MILWAYAKTALQRQIQPNTTNPRNSQTTPTTNPQKPNYAQHQAVTMKSQKNGRYRMRLHNFALRQIILKFLNITAKNHKI